MQMMKLGDGVVGIKTQEGGGGEEERGIKRDKGKGRGRGSCKLQHGRGANCTRVVAFHRSCPPAGSRAWLHSMRV